MLVENIVVKEDGKWYVKSHKGKNLGGPYDSEAEAKKRLAEVEAFKHTKNKNQFQEITFNIKPVIRHDIMEGRPFLVAPMVMIAEGVLNGSNGALFYPAEELSKTPVVWNHKPIVVYHPNGTACDPTVLSSRKVGVIMNTVFEDGKLKAEAWLEADRMKAVDNRVLEAIEKNQMMELSTGLFTDNEDTAGEWNGKSYDAIARNYRPDHLALLPDMKGACSIEDGAGFLRLNEEKKELVINGKSFNQISDLLNAKLRETQQDAWVNDVFDNHFIYSINGKLYSQNYIIGKEDKITFKGLPVEVIREINYVTVNNSNFERNSKMDKKTEIINQLISNKNTNWEETDREYLTTLEETVLNKMIPIENKVLSDEEKKKLEDEKKAKEAAAKNEEDEKKAKEAAAKVTNEETADAFIQKAPKEIQDVLNSGLNTYKQEKAKLIETIIANKKNTFTKEQLEAKNVQELKAISVLAMDKNEANYSGQGDEDIANNSETPLEMPVMNFAPDKK